MATSGSGRDFVLDLGTSTLRLGRVAAGKYGGPDSLTTDHIVEMPALTLVDQERHSVVAVGGQAAIIARGTLPSGVEAVRPLRDGLIATFDPAVALVRAALHEATGGERALRRLTRRPRALYSLPATATDAARMVVNDVLSYAGISSSTAVPRSLAAGVGAVLPVRGSRPCIICDIGAGVVEIAVLASGKVIVARSWPLGGDWFNRATVRAVRRRRGITITNAMAEDAIREVGTLDDQYDYLRGRPSAAVAAGGDGSDTASGTIARRRGRGTGPLMTGVSAGGVFGEMPANPHTSSGLPEFNSQDVAAGLSDAVHLLVQQLAWFWEDLDLTTRDTVDATGLMLTGASAKLPGLPAAISRALEVPVIVADDPAGATIRGLLELATDVAVWQNEWPWPPEWEFGR